MARSAPLFIALASALLFGERFSWVGMAGIALSSAALILLAAMGTTVYSLSDKVAVAHLPGFASQLGYISLGYLCAWTVLTLRLRRESGHWLPRQRPPLGVLAAGSLSIGTSYALVVHAMSGMSAAYTVALSNGGIVIATWLSVFWFREAEHRGARLFWATVLAAGLSLVALSN